MMVDKERLICEKLIDMMEEKSFFDIKVKEFAEFAGIGRSTFYLYFDSLYDVLQQIEDEYLAGMVDESTMAQKARGLEMEKFNAAFVAKVSYIEQNKRLLRVLLGENGDPSFSARIINRYKRIARKSFDGMGEYSPVEVEMLAEYSSAGYLQVLKWWLEHEDDIDLCDMMLSMERYTIALRNGAKAT